MQISSRRNGVYVLARKYTVMNMYNHDGINTLLQGFTHISLEKISPERVQHCNKERLLCNSSNCVVSQLILLSVYC